MHPEPSEAPTGTKVSMSREGWPVVSPTSETKPDQRLLELIWKHERLNQVAVWSFENFKISQREFFLLTLDKSESLKLFSWVYYGTQGSQIVKL